MKVYWSLKNSWELERDTVVLLSYQVKRSLLLYQSLVWDEKLREVSVSSFSSLVNKHFTNLLKLRAAFVRESRHFPDE